MRLTKNVSVVSHVLVLVSYWYLFIKDFLPLVFCLEMRKNLSCCSLVWFGFWDYRGSVWLELLWIGQKQGL